MEDGLQKSHNLVTSYELVVLVQAFSVGVILPTRGHLIMSGDMFVCHNSECYGHLLEEVKEASKYPAMHGTVPITKN